MEHTHRQGEGRLPHILFEVAGQPYAIDSGRVTSISRLGEVFKVRGAKAYIRGREGQEKNDKKLIDLRVLFGTVSMKSEKTDFAKRIQEMKKAHINWVAALEQSAEQLIPFQLTTDPHQCKLGQWYDNFSTESPEVGLVLKRISKPHTLLHASGVEVQEAVARGDRAAAMAIAKHTKERYAAEVLALLDQLVQVYDDTISEMVLTIEQQDASVGILADKVLGVHPLISLAGREVLDPIHPSSVVMGVARRENSEELIVLLDDQGLVQLGQGE